MTLHHESQTQRRASEKSRPKSGPHLGLHNPI